MNIDPSTIFLLSSIIIIVTGLAIAHAIDSNKQLNKRIKEYTTLRKHYGKLYNIVHDEEERTHDFYGLELQYLNQDSYSESSACQNTKWYLTEQDMLEAIEKHNKIAYQVRAKLDKLNLSHSDKAMYDKNSEDWKESLDHSKEYQDEVYKKSMEGRAEWYKQVDKIADELSIDHSSSYGYCGVQFPIDIEDLKDSSGNWYNTKTIDVSKEGVQNLLNKIAY